MYGVSLASSKVNSVITCQRHRIQQRAESGSQLSLWDPATQAAGDPGSGIRDPRSGSRDPGRRYLPREAWLLAEYEIAAVLLVPLFENELPPEMVPSLIGRVALEDVEADRVGVVAAVAGVLPRVGLGELDDELGRRPVDVEQPGRWGSGGVGRGGMEWDGMGRDGIWMGWDLDGIRMAMAMVHGWGGDGMWLGWR